MPSKPVKGLCLRSGIGSGLSVDRDLGAILGVSVITAGVTQISGDGVAPFDVDRVSLQQVADAINASETGIKSRITHPELFEEDDLPRRLGYVRNARVEGNAVKADMFFHNPGSEHAITLMDIAARDPGSCGLSIVSETATVEAAQTSTGGVLRLSVLDAIDWVGSPAANPAGMLSASRRQRRITLKELGMFNQQQLEYLYGLGLDPDANAEAINAFVEGLEDGQKSALAALGQIAANTPEGEAEEEVAAETAPAPEEVGVAANTLTDEQLVGEADEEVPAPGMTPQVSANAPPLSQAIAADRKRERARVKEIKAIALRCGYDDAWVDKHVDSDTPIGEVRRVALASLKREPKDMTTTHVSVGADLNRDTLNQAVQDAIMLRVGTHRMARFDDSGRVMLAENKTPLTRDPHERANEFRSHSIIEMGRRYLLSLGYDKADSMSRTALASLLMSRTKLAAALPGVYLAQATGDFPFILADTMGKQLRNEYVLAPHTWERWCNRTTAPDFKTIKKIQLSEAADLSVIDEGDEYTYASLSEGQETYALETQGKGLKFTRQMLINDDLSAFDRVPRLMGRAAARAEEAAAIAILTANAALADGNALFSTAHANLTTGTLSVTSLGAAKAAMSRQTALGSDDPLELMPAVLLVPVTIETTARQLVASTVDPALNNATPNPFANAVEVVPSARLDTDSTAQWYLFASPNEIDTVEMAFLEGEETPVVEEEDEFDSDVRKVKVRHTFKPKAIDYRGMIRSSGA